MKQSEKLREMADDLLNDIYSARDGKINLEKVRSITMLSNQVIKAIVASMKLNDSK